MHRAMMPSTQRDHEFIADLAAKGTGLGKSEVVGIRGFAAAQQARLVSDVAQMLTVAMASRGRYRKRALVDALCLTRLGVFGGAIHLGSHNLRYRRLVVRDCGRLA